MIKRVAKRVAETRASAWPAGCAAWLSEDVVLLVGNDSTDDSGAEVHVGEHRAQCEALACTEDGREGTRRLILAVACIAGGDAADPVVRVSQSGRAIEVGPISRLRGDLPSLLRRHLSPLDARSRHRVMECVLEGVAALGTGISRVLAQSLGQMREALRERMPEVAVAPDSSQGLHVDAIHRLDERSFYMRGRLRNGVSDPARLTAVAPEGWRVELAGRVFRHSRPQDGSAGFVCCFELPGTSVLPDGWVLEMECRGGPAGEVEAPAVIDDASASREALLEDLQHERPGGDSLRLGHALPGLTRLDERHRRTLKIDQMQDYGSQPDAPDVSILVPLYKRIDFVEQQLAQFVHDPELCQAELIYVLDSPELADALLDTAAALHRLYRLPMRLAILNRNAGFAGANNLAAKLARGRLLVLLNSDVLPDRPGWLGLMRAFYDSTPRIGALGAKLLFEDDSLQHAGMYFRRDEKSGLWENQHYFKGMHGSLPAANVARRVPAVTGACMMVRRDLYREVCGLSGTYIQGDYEDSDLCLRLQAAGHEIWYLPTAQLYHLEGQSYALPARVRNGQFNRWLHTRQWNADIEQIMEHYSA